MANPPIFAEVGGIYEALDIARSLPRPTDLPPELPGLMLPPKPKIVPNGQPSAAAQVAEPDGRPPATELPETDAQREARLANEERLAREAAERAKRLIDEARAAEAQAVNPYIELVAVIDRLSRVLGALRDDGNADAVAIVEEAKRLIPKATMSLRRRDSVVRLAAVSPDAL